MAEGFTSTFPAIILRRIAQTLAKGDGQIILKVQF